MFLEINNFGPISHADIHINKLNIVGGKNSTGKSTVSKLLYCFLRANSFDRQKLIMNSLNNQISRFDSRLNRLRQYDNNNRFSRNEIKTYDLNNLDLNLAIEYYGFLKSEFAELFYNGYDSYNKNVQKSIEDSYKLIEIIEDLINIILEDSYDLYFSMIKMLLDSEFDLSFKNSDNKVPEDEINDFKSNSFARIYGEDLEYLIDFENEFLAANGLIDLERIYFIDSLSIFDAFVLVNSETEHNKNLKSALFEEINEPDVFDDIIYKDTLNIEKKLNDILNGKMHFDKKGLNYIEDGDEISMKNTSSGIKQLAILQLLLEKRKLTPNSFLILDEPEVHLHPKWQIDFAAILVLIAKELDVSIHINTHSPMFIEALYTFSEYYDFEDFTNYYLSEVSDNGNKFNFTQIDSYELYKIYDNLGEPYDELDSIRLGRK